MGEVSVLLLSVPVLKRCLDNLYLPVPVSTKRTLYGCPIGEAQ